MANAENLWKRPKMVGRTARSLSYFAHPAVRDRLWDQQMKLHPHVHFIIPAGGLEKTEKWIENTIGN